MYVCMYVCMYVQGAETKSGIFLYNNKRLYGGVTVSKLD